LTSKQYASKHWFKKVTRMLRHGFGLGALIALTGCMAVVPVVPLSVKPGERISIINLKTVESTVDKSLQDTVAISFVPPLAMSVDQISYSIDGKPATSDEFDLVLDTAKLKLGEHVITLSARGDGNVVRGATHLMIIESGKSPASSAGSAADATTGQSGDLAAKLPTQGKSSQLPPGKSNKAAPQLAGGATDAKAKVSIRIKMPDD
jgi:hypothetical protein